jgi:FkbM family methyltransferase
MSRTSEERHALYDTWTFEIMDRVLARDSNCIDVGAHAGTVLEEIVRRAPDGEHFAFEPLPAMMGILRERFPVERFPRVRFHELALAEQAGQAAFEYVVDEPAYSGLRRRAYPTEAPRIESLRVRVDRLDAVVPPATPIRFVKIDVEGGECGVLRGASRILERSRPYVVFEFGLGAADFYGVRPDDVWSTLAASRLQVSALDDWLEGRAALAAADFGERFAKGLDYYFLAHP